MIDALKEEQIVNKVGGRFKLSTLIQKRLAAINAGSPIGRFPIQRQDGNCRSRDSPE